MVAELDKGKLKLLLREADDKLFLGSKRPTYEQHLEFTAAHIAQNYNKARRIHGIPSENKSQRIH